MGDPLDKNTDVGAINSKAQLEKITELVASGVAEGADLYQPACDLPERGYFFRPTLFTNVAQSHRIAREEIFGPVLSVLTFRTPEEAVEKANNTPYGLSAGVWTDKGSRILEMVSRHAGRRRVGQHVQQVRPDLAVRWLQGVRASGARAACTGCTHTCGWRTADGRRPQRRIGQRDVAQRASANGAGPRIGVRKTYKLYIGGAFPRSESGRSYLVSAADGTPLANAVRASRKDVRDAVRAARTARSRAGPRKTAMNRGQVLYRVAELMEGRRDQFVAEVAAAEGLRDARATRGRRPRDRPLGLVRRLGRQDHADPGLGQPGRGAVLQLHDPGADGRRRRRRAGDVVPARAREPARAAARLRQRRRAARRPKRARCRPSR